MQKLMMTVMAAVAAFATQAGTYSLTINEMWDDAKIAEMAATYDGVEIGSGSTLTLANGSAITFALPISGGGNLFKDGVGTLTLGGINTYSGELKILNGVLKTLETAAYAKTHLGNPSKVTVVDGATLDIGEVTTWDAYEILSANQPLYIEGYGFNGQGAVRRMTGKRQGAIGAIHLTGDSAFSNGVQYRANLFLDGHEYTIDGKGDSLNLFAMKVDPGDGGSIVAKGDLTLQNNWSNSAELKGDETNWLRLRGGNLTMYMPIETKWTMSVESSATVTGKKPANVDCANPNQWNGPVVLSNAVTMTLAPDAQGPLTFGEKVLGAEGGNVTFTGVGSVTMKKGLSIKQHSTWDNANGVLTMAKDSGVLHINGGCDLQQLMCYGGRLEVVNGEVNGLGSGINPFYQRSAGLTAATSYAYFSNVTFKTAANSRYWFMGDMEKTSGILELDKGSKAPLRGFLIGSDGGGSDRASWGALYQHEETEVSVVDSSNDGRFRMASGTGSYGYYDMKGGALTTACKGYVADKGFAVFHQSGGTVTHNADVAIATNGGEAVVWQTGGTSASRYLFDQGTPDGAKVTLAVEGEGTSYTFKGGLYNQRLGFSCLNDVTLTIAANDGGELKTVRLDRSSDSNSRAKFYVSFSGGKMHPTASSEIFNEVKPSAFIVQEGGLVYDTSDVAVGNSSILKCAIEAPTGRIVSEIALPADAGFALEPYIGSPKVAIVGTGVGAAAVAVFDEKARKVTGIHILASGTGYDETTTATIESADRTKTYACAVTTVEAPTTGKGLRKVGSNMLELRGANTFRGPAIVETGTLKFTGPTAVPEGMGADVWQNATLNLGADIRCLSDLKGCGTVTCDKAVSVTNALVLAATNSALTVTAQSFTLADGVRIEVPNFDEIKDGAVENFALLSVPGGITYEGEVVLPDVGDGWKVRCKATDIELKRHTGFSIILR